jgi:hypothetical protein
MAHSRADLKHFIANSGEIKRDINQRKTGITKKREQSHAGTI